MSYLFMKNDNIKWESNNWDAFSMTFPLYSKFDTNANQQLQLLDGYLFFKIRQTEATIVFLLRAFI